MSSILLKGLLVCLVIASWSSIVISSATQNRAALDAWKSFVKTYQKTYATAEEYKLRQVSEMLSIYNLELVINSAFCLIRRKEQFMKNYEALNSQNNKLWFYRYFGLASPLTEQTYKTGITKFSDLVSSHFGYIRLSWACFDLELGLWMAYRFSLLKSFWKNTLDWSFLQKWKLLLTRAISK